MSPEEDPGVEELSGAAVAAALLAAHLALIAAANCARRSGVRLSFFFTFLGALDALTAAAGFTRSFVGADRRLAAFPPGAADFFFALDAAAVSAAASFSFSRVSFFAPFCRRVSSRRIFFLRLLNLAISNEGSVVSIKGNDQLKLRGNHQNLRMSR